MGIESRHDEGGINPNERERQFNITGTGLIPTSTVSTNVETVGGPRSQDAVRPLTPLDVFLAGERNRLVSLSAASQIIEIYALQVELSKGFYNRSSKDAHEIRGLFLQDARTNLATSGNQGTDDSEAFKKAVKGFEDVVTMYERQALGENPRLNLFSVTQIVAKRMSDDLEIARNLLTKDHDDS